MNVFILDRSMEKSAQMLDDAHLKAQINEACQVLMANYNNERYPDAKIGHVHHPVTKYYSEESNRYELFSYLAYLVREYEHRFSKIHQNAMFFIGFGTFARIEPKHYGLMNEFQEAKTYVNGSMTDDIEAIRHYISTKPMKKQPTWTNRKKPDWWDLYGKQKHYVQ